MSATAAPLPPSGDLVPPSRGRASAIGAVAFLLLAAPFLVFGGMMLTLKARVELTCAPGGPCTLVQRGWLGSEEVGRFAVEELQGVTVERNRSSRKGAANVYRPMLETTRGKFPLSSRWLDEEAQATATAEAVNAFRAQPREGNKGLTLFHDHRRGPLIVGTSFGSVGLLLLGVSIWLALKARRHFRAERAARASRLL